MEGRLTINQKKSIERFIHTGAKTFTLMYSFTKDGADNTTFHEMCDNKGPTVTVIYNTKGSVYGGYTEKSWTSDSRTFYQDDKAFLFRLMHDHKDVLNKFPVKAPGNAIYCDEDYGPIFGNDDIQTFSGTLTQTSGEFTIDGTFSIGTTYDMGGVTEDQFTNSIKTLYDLEVYSVNETPLASNWRSCSGWDGEVLQNLKFDVEKYSPPRSDGIETANFLVLGPVGAGKSSFLNTMASVFRGNISVEAYRMYRLRKSASSKPLQFCLCDTMGLEDSCGIDGQELNYLLDGNVPDGYEFNPNKQISSDAFGFISSPKLGLKIHCVCFILDGTTALVLSEKMTEKIKTLQSKIRQKGAKTFNLLFSFTKDGAANTTFHQKCDNKGPTVTVIYNTKGSVYGGYTGKSWTSDSGNFYPDDKAFLFRLMHDHKDVLNKFPVKVPGNAINCNANYGPIFGNNDIQTFSGSITQTSGQFTINGTLSIGTSYDMVGDTEGQLTNRIKTIYDLEVYSVNETPLASYWRSCSGWDGEVLQNLKCDVEKYSPPRSVGIKTANILVLGPVGAGKSSFFNTMASVFRGNISDEAVCGSAEQSITSKYRMYRVRKSASSKPLQFCLCDTMGLEDSCGIDGQELNYLLDGNVPDGYEFNPNKQISSDTLGFISSPKLDQKIHCVCFILDGTTALVLSEKMTEKLKTLQSKIRKKEIPHSFVLTKIDKVCSYVEDDVSNVFRSDAVKNLVEKVAASFGISRNQVLPMKNYEHEVEVDEHVNILALVTMKRLLMSVDNHFNKFLKDFDYSVGGSKNFVEDAS